MLKYIIFILVFNVLCFAKDFDIYKISDRKPVVKRQVPPETVVTEANAILQRLSNADSVKKDLTQKENSNSGAINPQSASKNESHVQIKKEDASKNQTESQPKNDKNAVSGIDEASNNSSSTEPNLKNPKHVEHPGAALRGFYVFLGLSILIIIYFIFKAFRLRPGAPPPTTVRKYGIVGRRSDMEMLPLPLAEEDDDDTLFDMGTQINR